MTVQEAASIVDWTGWRSNVISSPNTIAGAAGPLRIAANRRNALKSTGPRIAAGKRRVALNARRRDLRSEQAEQQVPARGRTLASFAGGNAT